MSPRRRRHLGRRAAVVTLAALTSGGCGLGETVRTDLVGIRPAPQEQATTGAPMSAARAAAAAERATSAITAARATPGAARDEALRKVLTGSALVFARAEKGRGGPARPPAFAASATNVQVLSQSRGAAWPRSLLVGLLDAKSNVQYLQLLTSRSPSAPFVASASLPMFGGASLPSLGAGTSGAALVEPTDGSGMVASPAKVLEVYASFLDRPKKVASPLFSTSTDAFASSLDRTYAAQVKGLKGLATLTTNHQSVPEETVAVRLADGGAVVLGRLMRTDTFTVGAKAKEITIPAAYAGLTRAKTAKKTLRLTWYEGVILVIPPKGQVKAIGATEELVSGAAQ